MTSPATGAELSVEELREKYRIERDKRMGGGGLAQYRELGAVDEEFDRDPYVEPGFTREPIVEETEAVIVGGGFGGMLAGINLTKKGVTDFRIIEKAGDFGGTWYWNRYPGAACDVESYVYLPLLEETGYMPTEKYAKAPEIFAYCQLLGRTFDLYRAALFQTEVASAEWNDETQRWLVTTSRGDQLSARFFVIAGGILSKAKLPGIEGIETFEGKAFHTSRWDYDYTGGSAFEPMVNLADKRVGIIGTGATAVQVVPKLAESAKEVYVFQRTPSTVGWRRQQAHRRGVVQEPRAGLAVGARRELHERRHGRAARRRPGAGRLDRDDVGRRQEGPRVRGGGGPARADRLREHERRAGPHQGHRRGSRHRGAAHALVRPVVQAAVLPRRVPAGVQPTERPPRRHRGRRRAAHHARRARWSTASSTRSTC